MNPEVTKENCLDLIDRLASKELTADPFNLTETEKDWLEGFYESAWTVDTMKLTELEERIRGRLTGDFLYRHMEVYDWNLPYAEAMILIVRQELKKWIEYKGHPILIGDVLEKMEFAEGQFMVKSDEQRRWVSLPELIEPWDACGITKSLQSILSEAVWEEEAVWYAGAPTGASVQVPKQSAICGLFTLLLQLFPKP